LKFLGPEGYGSSADLLRALGYARTMKELSTSSGGVTGANIRVLNNSYSGGGFSQAELDMIRALGDQGILFVVAAGNETRDNDRYPTYPSSYRANNILSVSTFSIVNRIREGGTTGLPALLNVGAIRGASTIAVSPPSSLSWSSRRRVT
jgi:hypothetical protein